MSGLDDGKSSTRLLPASTTHRSVPRNAPATGALKPVELASTWPRFFFPEVLSDCPNQFAKGGDGFVSVAWSQRSGVSYRVMRFAAVSATYTKVPSVNTPW